MNQLGRSQLWMLEPELDELDERDEFAMPEMLEMPEPRANRQSDQQSQNGGLREHRGRKRSEAALANEASQALCSGCLDRPDPDCAACGAPATVWTEAGDGRHAVAWCAGCHALLLSGRPPAAAPLVYLTLPSPAPAA